MRRVILILLMCVAFLSIIPVVEYETVTVTETITIELTPNGSFLAQGELQNGVTVYSSLEFDHDTRMYTIEVSHFAASIHGVLTCPYEADFDLYGRAGLQPTTDSYDWRGFSTTGEDETYSSPTPGTWYIMVRSFSGSGSFSLTVTIQYETFEVNEQIPDGVSVQGFLSSSGSQYWDFIVPHNASSYHVVLHCGSNDFDLYARWQTLPSRGNYDWSSLAVGGEDFTQDNPATGQWYLLVYAFSGSGSYELTISMDYSRAVIFSIFDFLFSPTGIMIMCVGVLGVVVIYQIARRPKSDPYYGYTPSHEVYGDRQPRYCSYCGTLQKPGAHSCHECSSILPRD